ncbi:MAG: double zinc ribbon domain-containing protein, partial [Proteobacteria bacterium]|nr:double zinc ribbon domain-containing protein [Pseudomonadota bacterium]
MIPWSIGQAQALAARAGRAALDALLPPRCIACDEPVAAQGQLCAACWSRLRFIAPPHCACCGVPFDYDPGDGALCAGCIASPPAYRSARAVLVYDDGSRDLILPLKHADRTDAAPTFGAWLARAGAELLAEAAIVAPVPL